MGFIASVWEIDTSRSTKSNESIENMILHSFRIFVINNIKAAAESIMFTLNWYSKRCKLKAIHIGEREPIKSAV